MDRFAVTTALVLHEPDIQPQISHICMQTLFIHELSFSILRPDWANNFHLNPFTYWHASISYYIKLIQTKIMLNDVEPKSPQIQRSKLRRVNDLSPSVWRLKVQYEIIKNKSSRYISVNSCQISMGSSIFEGNEHLWDPLCSFFFKVISATLQNQTQWKPHFLHDQVA